MDTKGKLKKILAILLASAPCYGVCPLSSFPENAKLDQEINNLCENIASPQIKYLPSSFISGTFTNNDAVASRLGEYIKGTFSASNFPASGDWGDAVSINLTAGDWDVTLILCSLYNSATVSQIAGGISTTSGNDSTGLSLGDNQANTLGPTATTAACVSVPTWRKTLTATTTLYAKYTADYTIATPKAYGRLSARRPR